MPELDITSDLDGSPNEGALSDLPSSQNGIGVQHQNADGAVQTKPEGVVNANEATPKPEEKEYSLRDQLSSAFKPGDPAPAEKPADAPVLTKDESGKYRQPDGTFASAEQITAFEAAQAPAASTPEAPAFLSRMTPLEQQQFNALPAETREFLGRTMEAVEGQAARYNEYGMLEQQLIGPRRDAWAANGMTPTVALNQLLQLSDNAARDPKAFVLWFAEQHQIDLDAALDERDALLSQNPEMRELHGQVQQLQQQLANRDTGQNQAQEQANIQVVQTWAEEKDGAGGLKRPYLTDVIADWPAQIQVARVSNPQMPHAEILQKAYDAACWANPTIRARMQEDVLKQQQVEARERAAKAKHAGASVNGAANGAVLDPQTQQNSNLGIRETLQAAFAEHRA